MKDFRIGCLVEPDAENPFWYDKVGLLKRLQSIQWVAVHKNTNTGTICVSPSTLTGTPLEEKQSADVFRSAGLIKGEGQVWGPNQIKILASYWTASYWKPLPLIDLQGDLLY